ncbi:BTB/POZ and MATH domain-containing protein 3-like [Aegilops tauschii subsp. strangulata]|uniref:BTB/POZ and MATH domain-containing protein 3-like n=1 Tax=Aegilops tauschii subsp. strangulata TaxID=200361 RepID=UPI003CC8AC47
MAQPSGGHDDGGLCLGRGGASFARQRPSKWWFYAIYSTEVALAPVTSTPGLLCALRAETRQQITASTVTARQATGSHIFSIEGFTRVWEMVPNGSAVTSRPFSAGRHEWRILCYPNGQKEKSEGHLPLFLRHATHVKTGNAKAAYTMTKLDKFLKPSYTGIGDRHFDNDSGWGWGKFMKLEDLDKEEFLKDDCLAVLCDLSASQGKRASASPPFDLHGFALPEAIWNKQAADVMIHVGDDGQMVAAHRWVLEARSPVFKADLALASSTGENIAELRVDGMDADVCKALLRFIYTDSPPPEFDAATMMAERLLVAVDRYALEKLKLACEDALCKKIDASSVAAALSRAERHRCPALKEACMQFLVKNMPTHHEQPPISTSSQLFSYANHETK